MEGEGYKESRVEGSPQHPPRPLASLSSQRCFAMARDTGQGEGGERVRGRKVRVRLHASGPLWTQEGWTLVVA